jgi:hypothetical protein
MMNNEPNAESISPDDPRRMWRELNSHVFTIEGSGDAQRDWREICELARVGLPPLSFRFHMPSGITHDYMREDVHHKLAKDEFDSGLALGREQERSARRMDFGLVFTLGVMLGIALAAALTWWGLARHTAEVLAR